MIQFMTPIDFLRTSMAIWSRAAELQIDMMRMSFGMAEDLCSPMTTPTTTMMEAMRLPTTPGASKAPEAPVRKTARPAAGVKLVHAAETKAEAPKPVPTRPSAKPDAANRKEAAEADAPGPATEAAEVAKAPEPVAPKPVEPAPAATNGAAAEAPEAPAKAAPASKSPRRRAPSKPATPENLTAPEAKKASAKPRAAAPIQPLRPRRPSNLPRRRPRMQRRRTRPKSSPRTPLRQKGTRSDR